MLKYISILIIALSVNIAYTQSQFDFSCGTSTANPPPTPLGMGMAKPMKTPPANDQTKYLRVLMVFVEFANEIDGSTTYWSPGQMPVYYNQLFAPQKQLGLTAYENYKVSDYFNKVSRDEFDMIGDVYHVILSHEYNYYSNIYQSQTEVFSILDNDPNFEWSRYDLWSWNPNTQQYERVPDNYIDMIYVQYRKVNPFGVTYGGIGSTLVDYTTRDGKHINPSSESYIGSGVTGVDGSDMSIDAVVGLFRHEYCHYALGDHKPYSTIAGGDGTNTAYGYELGMSPMDMIAVGYDNTINFSSSITDYSVGDLHSTGDIIKIPTGTANEYFLVSNRRRIIGDNNGKIYDCNMAGDTAMGRPFLQFKDYSKGLYIYHVAYMDGFNFWADLECADGLWNWDLAPYTTTPDWSSSQQLPVFIKTGVGYNDDNPLSAVDDNTRMSSRDGHSVDDYMNSVGTGYHVKWFSFGKRHESLNQQGIDKIYTNLQEDWCSRECMGDRWDAWAIDYNQVFSPYSSPNTKDKANNNTGMFVYYEGLDVNQVATIKIYYGLPNTQEEADALFATPPSKPMGLSISYTNCENDFCHPELTWYHNMEPDMIRHNNEAPVKRYRIYRAVSNSVNDIPVNYTHIGDIDIGIYATPIFVDIQNFIKCSGEQSLKYSRYKITAVDTTDWESVKSDFVSTGTFKVTGKNIFVINSAPKYFQLYQNYPNPFNPVTEIKFDLPFNSFVTLKIYNLLGQEVATIMSKEDKVAVSYTIQFDGSNLASGVYLYRFEAGTFVNSRKMVLIK